MGIYTRLFRYRQTESLSPKENFLTEALADLFNRLPADKQATFLVDALHPLWAEEIRARCGRTRVIEAQTQVSIAVDGAVKRPDMIISLDARPFVVVEVKVDAGLQRHAVVSDDVGAAEPAEGRTLDRDQLTTYARWIAAQSRDGWPGAVVFITHSTPAPDEFGADGYSGPIEMTHRWKAVGDWLDDNLDFDNPDDTCGALAADLYEFLSEENLMPEFMTAQDLAATSLFLPSAANVRHTFSAVLKEVSRAHPGARSGSVKVDSWSEANAYIGWFYLNRGINIRRSAFALSIGICFGGDAALSDEESANLPRHEPFFFIYIADENNRVPITDILSVVPEEWHLIHQDWSAVLVRTLGSFPADPNLRAEGLIAWARAEVGRLLAHIPTYQGGPAVEGDGDDEE